MEGSHDAIIEHAEWQLVQTEIQRRRNAGRKSARKFESNGQVPESPGYPARYFFMPTSLFPYGQFMEDVMVDYYAVKIVIQFMMMIILT